MADYCVGTSKGAAGVAGATGKFLFGFLAAIALMVVGCKQRQEEAPKAAPVAQESVALCRSTTALLPMVVAEKQGFFAEQGLTVTVRESIMGKEAFEGMLKGECELATAAEPPVVEYARQRDDFRLLAALQSSDNLNRIVARADRGIAAPKDLRGKRIATTKGTAPHYFLELFLEKNGLKSQDVVIVFMKSDDLLAALTNGQVDAVSMINNVVSKAREALQANAVLMEEPGLCRNYYLLLATANLLEKRPEVVVRFLRALVKAEEFITQKPKETLAMVLARQGQKESSAEIKELLAGYQYRLSLEHGMLMGLEDMARWTGQQGGENQRVIPNFLNLIAAEPLRAVKPEAVRLEK